jgi:hypothetical protein
VSLYFRYILPGYKSSVVPKPEMACKLLEIVKTADQDDAAKNFIRQEIVKMMPRKLTTKELQKIE